MRKSKLDLAKRLNRSRKRKYDKFLTSSLYLTITLVLCYLVYLNLPWSFHLFMRWATKGGDLNKIPDKFYAELNQLCLRADSTGEVRTRNYTEYTEIAESLGTFRCTLVNGGQEWLIEDYKSFSSADEAILGTQFAVFITEILGTDYSYRIRAYIPRY
ncbi:hypothetical protein IQ232_05880 [Microcystis aeruginosa LEGE 11464]|jgi:hypothetical protein|uniref:hypothetical protein n=1 Tax=Microcystis TaxID=1125 RepID=UPI00187DF8A0|nr:MULTISPECIES: hypothetical protein [Microcystis]MCZ8126069.1 hypothetical protein [Microcystis sp. LE19-114.1B]MCZ8276578.1 hypothetical protein [Microcystis sp. LE19-4.1E]MBE9089331.1 hypothetical protein [Microcystis aeruginosa LEGE 11464]MCA2657903.1 hypothetical protein [Microcystis sp. M049S2]MCZ8067462.1 hypothetical protein [Microcystis sp. LE17-20D]